MKLKAVLFDLDGTLLPMDLGKFLEAYFVLLSKRLVPHGYDPKKLVKAIWSCTGAMIANDGSVTNEQAFWNAFSAIYGEDSKKSAPYFEEFYHEDFDSLRDICGYNPRAKEIVDLVRSNGLRVVLATSPLYPAIATQKRICWTGLSPDDFELITTFENYHYAKPDPAYYIEVLQAIGLSAEECLMVGNDVEEDMIAKTLGMKVFLLTESLINKYEKDISVYPHGDWDDFLNYLNACIEKGAD